MKFRILKTMIAAAAFAAGAAHAVVALPQLNIDTSKATVSGLSSGGFMANQLGYAYASTFKGVGVFAAGPYNCAAHNNYTACMYNATISAAQLSTLQTDINNFSGTSNDNKSNVAAQKIFMFVGSSDSTVGPNPMNAVKTQYTNNGVTAANQSFVNQSGAGHTFPTDFDSTGNNSCGTTASPYISNCSYDGAKAALTMFYGALNARNNSPSASNFIEFDQTAFTNNAGMAATGWAYIPTSCSTGTQCKVHVALHGCLQNYATIGDKFVKNTGYARWADTNNIVVLFPQTKVDNTSHTTAGSGSLANPNGCWDWTGWYGTNFAQKAGVQAAAIKAMVDRVSSGTGSGGGTGGGGGTTTLAAPTGVTTSNATTSSMKITWNAVTGAASYNVYRNANKTNALPVSATNFTDTGLAASTQYSWTVKAADASGNEGTASTAATGTTLAGSAPAVCFNASNYAHVQAGRATTSGGYTYANGSMANMGLYNTFYTTILKQTGPNYYVIGTCP